MSQAEVELSNPAQHESLSWLSVSKQSLLDRIGPAEIRRRCLHMIPGVIPIGLPLTPHGDVWPDWLLAIAVTFSAAGLITAVAASSLVKRSGEGDWVQAVWGYLLPPVAALLLFPGRAELCLMTLQIIAFGDGSATLGGKLLGGRTLPWNSRKTWSGFFCFVLFGSMAATYSYWGEARPALPIGQVWLICAVAAFGSALAESLPSRINDNFRVGMTALLLGLLLSP